MKRFPLSALLISIISLNLISCDDGEGDSTTLPINDESCSEIGELSCSGNDLMMCSNHKLLPGSVVACQKGTFYSCTNGKLNSKTCETSCVVSNGTARCLDCTEQTESTDCKTGEFCVDGRCQKNQCKPECKLNDRDCIGDTNRWRLCQDIYGDGCYTWSNAVECGEGEKCVKGVCRDAASVENCNDECTNPSVRECDGTAGWRSCDMDDNGCLKLSELHPCENNTLCAGDRCWSTDNCTNECVTIGERTCSGKGYRECVQKGACKVWSDVASCPDGKTCKGGNCDDSTGACTNECNTKDETQCAGDNAYLICTDTNGDGCTEWSATIPCPTGQSCISNACTSAASNVPVRYLGDSIHSPITSYVVQNLKSIASKNSSRKDEHFMKLGDSHMMYESQFVKCFSEANTGANYEVNLDTHSNLSSAVSNFQSGSLDSFNRNSVSAVKGKTAAFPIDNNFSLMNQEISATNPRFAFYGYGSNDMGWYGYTKVKIDANNTGYYKAMQWYYRNVLTAVDELIKNGIIPLFIGVGPRNDTVTKVSSSSSVALPNGAHPKYFITTFNTILRGVAEAYQLPYMNLQKVLLPLNGYGLGNDGLHLNAATSACDLSSSGLAYGMNTRNLYSMEMLDRAWRVVSKNEPAPDAGGESFEGSGSASDPWIIKSLPFTHSANTAESPNKLINKYSCKKTASTQDESGGEYYYKLVLQSRTAIRTFVVSANNADTDLHITTSTDGNSCITRNDLGFEIILDPGEYYFIVDTFVSNGSAKPGKYLFGVHACDPDDTYCGVE